MDYFGCTGGNRADCLLSICVLFFSILLFLFVYHCFPLFLLIGFSSFWAIELVARALLLVLILFDFGFFSHFDDSQGDFPSDSRKITKNLRFICCFLFPTVFSFS